VRSAVMGPGPAFANDPTGPRFDLQALGHEVHRRWFGDHAVTFRNAPVPEGITLQGR